MRSKTRVIVSVYCKPKNRSGGRLRADGEPAGVCIPIEHLHGLARIFGQVLAHELQLREDVVGGRDNVAADLVRLEDVEELARARPQQLGLWTLGERVEASPHVRHRIDPGVGDASGEYGSSASATSATWATVITAVMLSRTPSRDIRRMTGPVNWLLVVTTGILTYTLRPQPPMTRPCR